MPHKCLPRSQRLQPVHHRVVVTNGTGRQHAHEQEDVEFQ
jgi:hypothetical protein